MVDLLARHGRQGKADAVGRGGEPVVALAVVEEQRAFGAGDLDPGGAVVGIAGRQVPAAADGHQHAVVHGHGGPHDVVGAVDGLHEPVGALGIDAHRFGRLQQPEGEVEVVGRFHGGGRELHARGDLLAEVARQVAADHDADRLAQRAVGDLLLRVGELGAEALRIADGELEVAAPGQFDQFVGLVQGERDRLLQQHMLARAQAVAGDGEVRVLGRGGDVNDVDCGVLDDVAVVWRGGGGVGELVDLRQAIGPDFAHVQPIDQRRTRKRLRADAAAPAGADHRHLDLTHRLFLPCAAAITPQSRLCRSATLPEVSRVASIPAKYEKLPTEYCAAGKGG